MHDLVDAGMVELGPSKDTQGGVKNPLSVKLIGDQEVIVSPGSSDMDSEENPMVCT